MDLRALVERVHHVAGELVRVAEPADLIAAAETRQHGHEGLLVRVPGVVWMAGLQPLVAHPLDRDDREGDVVAGDAEIVLHLVERQLEPGGMDHPALGVHLEVDHVLGEIPLGRKAEADEIAGLRIDLAVGRARRPRQGSVEVPGADGLQRHRVHGDRRGVLAQSQQHPVVDQDVGVGEVAAHPLDGRIVGPPVAVAPEQRPAGSVLRLPAVGADIAALQGDASILEAEHAGHAVAVERHVIEEPGRELVVGPDAIEGSVDLRRDLPLDLQVGDVDLDPRGRIDPGEHRQVGELDHRAPPWSHSGRATIGAPEF